MKRKLKKKVGSLVGPRHLEKIQGKKFSILLQIGHQLMERKYNAENMFALRLFSCIHNYDF